mgnify:CR=1 FL=1
MKKSLVILSILTSLGGSLDALKPDMPDMSAWARSDVGVVSSATYHDDKDYWTTTITTSDGMEWVLDDFYAMRGADVIVDFNTHNTTNLADDTIVSVTISYDFA